MFLIFSVYDDVSSALEQWHGVEGQKIYIYSSGSVQAQKLLFEKSLAGDLLKFIDGHFDTAVGPKQEATSYTAIIEKIDCKADDILFLTDIPKGQLFFLLFICKGYIMCFRLVMMEYNDVVYIKYFFE